MCRDCSGYNGALVGCALSVFQPGVPLWTALAATIGCHSIRKIEAPQNLCVVCGDLQRAVVDVCLRQLHSCAGINSEQRVFHPTPQSPHSLLQVHASARHLPGDGGAHGRRGCSNGAARSAARKNCSTTCNNLGTTSTEAVNLSQYKSCKSLGPSFRATLENKNHCSLRGMSARPRLGQPRLFVGKLDMQGRYPYEPFVLEWSA